MFNLDHNKNLKILEIGCGPGALAEALHRWYPKAEITRRVEEAAQTVTTAWKGRQYLALKNQAWNRLQAYYATLQ